MVVQHMLARVKAPTRLFVVKTCHGLNNAVALKQANVPYILLDVEWIESMKSGSSDWLHLMVIGHEIGHHLLGHTSRQATQPGEQKSLELEADRFAGYVLGTYGLAGAQVAHVLRGFPDDSDPNSTHPAKAQRIIAVRAGVDLSKGAEENKLLESLTKDVGLNLTSVPYLVSMARGKFDRFLVTRDKRELQQAVNFYQQAIRFSADPMLAHELGAMFFADGSGDRYAQALEYVYSLTKNKAYLLELASYYSSSRNATAEGIMQKHKDKLMQPELVGSLNDRSALSFANYHLARLEVNRDEEAKWLPPLRQALEGIVSKPASLPATEAHALLIAETQNTLGLLALREGDFNEAKQQLVAAANYFGRPILPNDFYELLYSNKTLNQLSSLTNLALVSIRLADWTEGLAYVNKLDKVYHTYQASLTKKSQLAFDYSQVAYFKGRVHQGLKNYPQAILHYSEAIVLAPEPYLYYYRGTCQLSRGNETEACADFKKACSIDGHTACDRVKMLCR